MSRATPLLSGCANPAGYDLLIGDTEDGAIIALMVDDDLPMDVRDGDTIELLRSADNHLWWHIGGINFLIKEVPDNIQPDVSILRLRQARVVDSTIVHLSKTVKAVS